MCMESSVPAGSESSPLVASAKGSKDWRFWIEDMRY
uniref:Uncharacterized protein n=1 Tax=Anguilla anguilla TaxID=7936 RepID=A0A0E9W5V8_ANGAN